MLNFKYYRITNILPFFIKDYRYTIPKIFFFLAFISLLFSICIGFFLSVYYTTSGYSFLKFFGITFRELRPIHTFFAFSWVFSCSIGVIYYYLFSNEFVIREKTLSIVFYYLHFFLWFFSGIFIFFFSLFGRISGREYFGYHPLISILILFGWFIFSYFFLKKFSIKKLLSQPIYIYFWLTGILYFFYSFIEAHTWLIPTIWRLPIVDLQLQWKSVGSFVASFNMLVYGIFSYLSRCLGDKDYSHSNTAFFLFSLGILNSFTNYTHHTYHIPQLLFVKWIGFIVSMLEIIIFMKVIQDVLFIFKVKIGKNLLKEKVVFSFINSVKWWNMLNLFIALLISVPFLNSAIHGTQVIFAHAMGSMIGIDSMILFSIISFIFFNNNSIGLNFLIPLVKILNIFLFIFVLLFTIVGIDNGLHIYLGDIKYNQSLVFLPSIFVFLSSGIFLSLFFIILIFLLNFCVRSAK